MIKIAIDTSQYEQKMKEFTKKLNKDAGDSIVELAQSSARQLAISTEPRGLTGKAKDISQNAVFFDFSKAYDYVGQTYNRLKAINFKTAIAFAKAVQAGDLQQAEKYARKYIGGFEMKTSDDGGHMDSVRNNKGRVKDNAETMGISDNSALQRIAEAKSKNIAYSKLAWLQAAQSLGAKTRIPAWIRKDKTYGSSRVLRNGWSTIIELHNRISYATNVLTTGKMRMALRAGYRNHLNKLQRQIDALCRKF